MGGSTLTAFIILLAFELIGEVLRAAVHLPVPGSVIGMFLLAAVLAAAKKIPMPRFTSAFDWALVGLYHQVVSCEARL